MFKVASMKFVVFMGAFGNLLAQQFPFWRSPRSSCRWSILERTLVCK
jgi:hypothetical protein